MRMTNPSKQGLLRNQQILNIQDAKLVVVGTPHRHSQTFRAPVVALVRCRVLVVIVCASSRSVEGLEHSCSAGSGKVRE